MIEVEAIARRPVILPGGSIGRSGVHRGLLIVCPIEYPDAPAQPPRLEFERAIFATIRDAATYAALIAALAAPRVIKNAPFIVVHAGNEAAGVALLDVASVIGRGHVSRPHIDQRVPEIENEAEEGDDGDR
jgi:hypothetical protein